MYDALRVKRFDGLCNGHFRAEVQNHQRPQQKRVVSGKVCDTMHDKPPFLYTKESVLNGLQEGLQTALVHDALFACLTAGRSKEVPKLADRYIKLWRKRRMQYQIETATALFCYFEHVQQASAFEEAYCQLQIGGKVYSGGSTC